MIFLCLIKFDLRTCCLTVFPMSKNFRSSIKRKLYLAEISFRTLPDSGVQSLTCKEFYPSFQQRKLISIKEFITSDIKFATKQTKEKRMTLHRGHFTIYLTKVQARKKCLRCRSGSSGSRFCRQFFRPGPECLSCCPDRQRRRGWTSFPA